MAPSKDSFATAQSMLTWIRQRLRVTWHIMTIAIYIYIYDDDDDGDDDDDDDDDDVCMYSVPTAKN